MEMVACGLLASACVKMEIGAVMLLSSDKAMGMSRKRVMGHGLTAACLFIRRPQGESRLPHAAGLQAG